MVLGREAVQAIDDSALTEGYRSQLGVGLDAPAWLRAFPNLLTVRLLPSAAVVLLAVFCAVLRRALGPWDTTDTFLRLALEALAMAGGGLFVSELLRNRRLARQGEARLRALVETSPTAIVTVDERGCIERANQAAAELMLPDGGSLVGRPVAAFLPQLHYVLLKGDAPQFRTSMRARGHRGNGEAFLAEMWCSTYEDGAKLRLVAIIADAAEEKPAASSNSGCATPADRSAFSAREMDVLRLLVQGQANKEIALGMGLSETAIKSTLQRIFAKTQVRSRSQLVRLALEQYRDLL
jgi:PAS domain S-box-containing protein